MKIYKITNKVNNKIYIGCTVLSLEKRLKSHYWKRNDGYALGRAIVKHGLDNFMIEEIDTASTKEEMLRKENNFVKQYNSRNPKIGYNIAPGGQAIGRFATIEEKEANRLRNIGRKISEETKLKISLAQKGKPRSREAAMKAALKKKGRKHTADHIRKRVLTRIGYKTSDETKLKQKLSNLGKKRSIETRQKVSEAVKKHHSENKLLLGEHIICMNNGKVYYSHQDAAEKLGLNRASITSMLNGSRPHTRKYKFQRLNEEHLIF